LATPESLPRITSRSIPLGLAAARGAAGDNRVLVEAIQALVDAAGAVLLFRLVIVLSGRRRAALVAGALYALYPLLIRHAVILHEFSLTGVLLIAFANSFVTAGTDRRAAAAGCGSARPS